jgi:hypothetical protein
MRHHISKAITRRSTSLRAALTRYNKLAPLQDTPHPILEYSEVAGYSWLGDFELLRHSRHDVTSKPWSMRSNREVAVKYFKVLHACEEIQ